MTSLKNHVADTNFFQRWSFRRLPIRRWKARKTVVQVYLLWWQNRCDEVIKSPWQPFIKTCWTTEIDFLHQTWSWFIKTSSSPPLHLVCSCYTDISTSSPIHLSSNEQTWCQSCGCGPFSSSLTCQYSPLTSQRTLLTQIKTTILSKKRWKSVAKNPRIDSWLNGFVMITVLIKKNAINCTIMWCYNNQHWQHP